MHIRAASLLLIGSFFVSEPRLGAQTNSGELTGRVTDKSTSVVSKAEVALKNLGTGDVRTTESNTEGYFVFAFVPPGVYEVSATATGFRKAIESAVPDGRSPPPYPKITARRRAIG
jgi:carboxypeptidase family protein